MRTVQPVNVNDSNLTATNVAEIIFDWTLGTYNIGDQRVYGESVYEALGTTSDRPDIGAAKSTPTWIRLGYSNIWRMFRDGADSRSTAPGEINVTIQTVAPATAIALLGLSGSHAYIMLTDDVEGIVYQADASLADIGVLDWWEYWFTDYDTVSSVYFPDIPAYGGAELNVLIEAATETANAECGRVVFGPEREIGVTVEGVQSRFEDFSTKTRDEFGNLTLVPRRTIRVVDYDFKVENTAVDFTQRAFSALAGTPAVFVGHPDLPETTVFGVYQSFQVIVNGHMITDCSLSVEEF